MFGDKNIVIKSCSSDCKYGVGIMADEKNETKKEKGFC